MAVELETGDRVIAKTTTVAKTNVRSGVCSGIPSVRTDSMPSLAAYAQQNALMECQTSAFSVRRNHTGEVWARSSYAQKILNSQVYSAIQSVVQVRKESDLYAGACAHKEQNNAECFASRQKKLA